VLGREFEVHVLAEMLQDDNFLLDEISTAERADIWTALSQIRYIFTHGLLRDAAYSMQMRARRMELHAIAVDALEKVYAAEVEYHYGELAYHAERTSLTEKAFHYLRLAGKAAADSYQNSQAVDYFSRALAFVPPDDLTAQYDLLAERVELYSRMGKRDLQWKDLIALERWAEQIEDDKTRLANVMLLWALYHHTTGHYLNAVEYSKRANSYLVLDAEPALGIKIQNYWSAALLRMGQPHEAMSQASVGLQLARSSRRRVDEAKVLTMMGLIALEQKDPGQAHKYLEDSVAIAREMQERKLEAYALNNLAISEGSVKGNYKLAMEYYEQSYKIAKELGDRYSECNALANLGFTAGMQGNIATAYLHHEHSLLVAREIGNTSAETYTLINLSAVSGIQKNAAQSLNYAKQADELSRKIQDRSAEAWSQLYMGHAYLLTADCVDAQKAYQRSIAIRNELEQPALALEPLAGLVEAALCMDDLEAAARETEQILTYFKEGGSLSGTEEPLRVYYACYQFLYQQKDPRAQQILQSAKQMLEAQVSNFKDEQARKLFVENFPWRQALYNARQH
jgi:tetratricopeptide (TPR) repeat protein